mgnify:FL=1
MVFRRISCEKVLKSALRKSKARGLFQRAFSSNDGSLTDILTDVLAAAYQLNVECEWIQLK